MIAQSQILGECKDGRLADLFCSDERCNLSAFLCSTCPCINQHMGHKMLNKKTLLATPMVKPQTINAIKEWHHTVLRLIQSTQQSLTNLKTEFLRHTDREYKKLLESDIDVRLIQSGLWKAHSVSGSELNQMLNLLKTSTLTKESFSLKKFENIKKYVNLEIEAVVSKIRSLWDPLSADTGKSTLLKGINLYKEKDINLEDVRWSRSNSVMLWQCQLPEHKWVPLLRELAAKPDIRNLCLSNCGVADQAACEIERMRSIEILDLNNNLIGDRAIKKIASKLFRLRELTLNMNQITDEGMTAIAQNLTNLTNLELRNNQIGSQGIIALAGSIDRMEKLASLNLCNTRIIIAFNRVQEMAAFELVVALTRPFDLSLVHNPIERSLKNLILSVRDKRVKLFL